MRMSESEESFMLTPRKTPFLSSRKPAFLSPKNPSFLSPRKTPKKPDTKDRSDTRKSVQRAHDWFVRMGRPSRDKMKTGLINNPDMGITEDELDLLPWNQDQSTLDLGVLQGLKEAESVGEVNKVHDIISDWRAQNEKKRLKALVEEEEERQQREADRVRGQIRKEAEKQRLYQEKRRQELRLEKLRSARAMSTRTMPVAEEESKKVETSKGNCENSKDENNEQTAKECKNKEDKGEQKLTLTKHFEKFIGEAEEAKREPSLKAEREGEQLQNLMEMAIITSSKKEKREMGEKKRKAGATKDEAGNCPRRKQESEEERRRLKSDRAERKSDRTERKSDRKSDRAGRTERKGGRTDRKAGREERKRQRPEKSESDQNRLEKLTEKWRQQLASGAICYQLERNKCEKLKMELTIRNGTKEEKKIIKEYCEARKLLAYQCWRRLGRPMKHEMHQQIETCDKVKHADVTQKDVDLLPWISDGYIVDVPQMMLWMTLLHPNVTETVDRWMEAHQQ